MGSGLDGGGAARRVTVVRRDPAWVGLWPGSRPQVVGTPTTVAYGGNGNGAEHAGDPA
ncbi:hypothetical protein GPN2_14314 [Streptomyces murinus]